jgi:hypothetical protein
MISRTTLIGTALILVTLGLIHRQVIINRINQIFVVSVVIAVVYLVLIPPSVKGTFENYFTYGFEMFFSYSESKELETSSTNDLIGMLFTTIPSDLKTLFIGDGIWLLPDGIYYGHTDVGYYRLIYYFGLIGCVAYIYYQYQIIRQSNLRTQRRYEMFFKLSFLLFLILNVKVLIEVIPIFILFLFSEDQPKETKSIPM